LAPPVGLEPTHAACTQGRFALPLKRQPKTPALGLLRHRCIAHRARSAPQQLTAAMRPLKQSCWFEPTGKDKQKQPPEMVAVFVG